jgi:transcriptional regulator with XRE-family HTH domain
MCWASRRFCWWRNEVVAERVREERDYLGFSLTHVARSCGLTEEDVAGIEAGTRPVAAGELELLAGLFGLDSPARLQGEPLTADPRLEVHLCGRADLTIDDHYTVHRFAEYLRNTGP